MRTRLIQASGPLVVYSAAFRPFCAALLEGFNQAYPDIELIFVDDISTRLHQRFLTLHEQGQPVPDLIWSSAMDLQMSLVLQQHAQPYSSSMVDQLPAWAQCQDQAFATTLEPLVHIAHRSAFSDLDRCSSLVEICSLMEQHGALLQGKLACFDIEKNGLSFLALLWASEPSGPYQRFRDLLARMQAQFYDSNPPLIEALQSKKALLGLNVLGSFAARALRQDPGLRVGAGQAPRLGVSRIALITRQANNPAAAGLFIDYLLSDAGQLRMAQDELFPLRWAQPIDEFPQFSIEPLAINQGFERFLDPQKRATLLADWQLIRQSDLALSL